MKHHTRAGREAYHAGRGIDVCPYKEGNSRRIEWLKGWLEADGYEIRIFMSALSKARRSGNFSTHMTEGFQAFETGIPLQNNP